MQRPSQPILQLFRGFKRRQLFEMRLSSREYLPGRRDLRTEKRMQKSWRSIELSAGDGAGYLLRQKVFQKMRLIQTEIESQVQVAEKVAVLLMMITGTVEWPMYQNSINNLGAYGNRQHPECHYRQKIGDLSGDGAVMTNDGKLLSQILAQQVPPPENICCADVNKDGILSVADVVKMERISQNIEASPGVCQIPVNGGWCAWNSCFKKNQHRECACPAPANGGRECVGPSARTCTSPAPAPIVK